MKKIILVALLLTAFSAQSAERMPLIMPAFESGLPKHMEQYSWSWSKCGLDALSEKESIQCFKAYLVSLASRYDLENEK